MATQNKQLVRGHLHPSSMRKMGAGVASTSHALVGQLIANALDAGARKIAVTIDKKGEFLQCEDNGAGMNQSVWSAFIGMGDPAKEGDAETIGENGTGHTANWMAFDRTDVWTAWADDPNCHHLGYSYAEAWKFSQENGKGGIESTSVVKSSSGARVKSTGTVIRLSSPWKDESAIRVLPKEVLRNIARVLSPWHLDMVTINGEKPKIDFPKGEFYRALDEIPGVGQIEIIAGFADDQVKDQDRSWGTWGAHVCTHSELLDQLPGRLSEGLAPELLHPYVWFMVRIHSWKHFEGKHTRRFFKPSLFKDPSFEEVVRHLHMVLLPEIRKHTRIDTQMEGMTDEVIDRVVNRLIERVGESTKGVQPPVRKPTTALAFRPARVGLVCGTTYVLNVLNADEHGIYELDATQSGGSILVDEKWLSGAKATATLSGPTQVTYRAGVEHGNRYKMRLTQQVTGEEIAQSAVCEIRLNRELNFAISPIELILEPGETGRVSVVNDDGKTGLTWFTTEKGRIAPSDDSRSAEVTAPMEPGNYTITCKASDGSQAEGRLSVRTAQPRASDEGTGGVAFKKTLTVDGMTFVVTSLPVSEASRHRSTLTMIGLIGEKAPIRYQIWFNFTAPEAQAALKERALDQLLTHEVVTLMAWKLKEREDTAEKSRVPVSMADVFVKRDQLMSKIYGQ